MGVAFLPLQEPLMKSLLGIWIVCLTTAVLCLVPSDSAQAQSGRRRARFAAPPRPANTNVHAAQVSPTWRTFSPYGLWHDNYSKYYGGFHSRYFDEIGYPSGDRPIRGTAW